MKPIIFAIFTLLLVTGCVSKKKYQTLQGNRDEIQQSYDRMQKESNREFLQLKEKCEYQMAELQENIRNLERNLDKRELKLSFEQNKISSLQKELEHFKSTNTTLLAHLSDLSVVSKAGAENIRQSLEALREQNLYIKDLTTSIQRKDSLNLALVMNLKRSLADVSDEDIQIEVKKGVVYISLSDKMLFKSGRYEILPRAQEVLGKIAKVVMDHSELDILVEGHTDNVPIKTDCLADNWDLSVMRATSVVRSLQEKHGVKPERMTAGGRGEYLPKTTNENSEGRSLNRRTEIIILPKLDQFFQLLEGPMTVNK